MRFWGTNIFLVIGLELCNILYWDLRLIFFFNMICSFNFSFYRWTPLLFIGLHFPLWPPYILIIFILYSKHILFPLILISLFFRPLEEIIIFNMLISSLGFIRIIFQFLHLFSYFFNRRWMILCYFSSLWNFFLIWVFVNYNVFLLFETILCSFFLGFFFLPRTNLSFLWLLFPLF